MVKDLRGAVAVVAGATRGAGRGIACALGDAGVTVYCTGRSTRGQPSEIGRPECIEETAELVTKAGGNGIPVKVDHTSAEEVDAFFERLKSEQNGRLNILVNDISGDSHMEYVKFGPWCASFYELTLQRGLQMQVQGVHSHIITSWYAAPLFVEQQQGLIVEIGDGNHMRYRGRLFYDLAKVSAVRLAFGMAQDLRKHNVTVVSLTPGYLRSEKMLEDFGVTEEHWQDGIDKDPMFKNSETPLYVGRAVAALAADPNVIEKTGRALSSGQLAIEYGFTDIDGRQPIWDHEIGVFEESGEFKLHGK